MAIRTPADLETALDAGLAWRRIEIYALRTSMRESAKGNPNAPLPRALRRSCVAMAYAHWEGYTKQAFADYTDYLKRRRPRLSQLNDGLFMTCVQVMTRKAEVSPDGRPMMLQMLRNLEHARAKLPLAELSDTKSNLRFKVLSAILTGLGLDLTRFETRQHWIDSVLCDQRNAIAHGRDHFPDHVEAADIAEQVLILMEAVRDLIMTSARTNGHLASQDKPAPIADPMTGCGRS